MCGRLDRRFTPGSSATEVAAHTSPRRLATAITPGTVTVAVIVPVRNEVRDIRATIDALLSQTFDPERTSIVIVDGESTDGTRAIIDGMASTQRRITVVNNPARSIPTALNLGIRNTTAEVIVRVDGRCRIAPDYVERCVALLAETRAGNVGGLVRPQGQGYMGNAIALAQRARFGVGNSHYHYLERRAWVDTVYMGAFRREVFDQVGVYDEELTRNQDDELNYRIRAAGYGILLDPGLVSVYTPARSLRQLWRKQYYQYGLWKVTVIRKHPGSAQARHLAPVALVGLLTASAAGALIARRKALALPILLYGCAVAGASAWTGRANPRAIPGVAAAFGCMHLAYGTGFAVGLLRLPFHRGKGRR